MEIPEINILADFSRVDKIPQVYNFWKWGALFFAIFAAFSSLIQRIKLIFIRFHTVKPSLHQFEDVFDFSGRDDDGDDISLASSDDEQEILEATPFNALRRVDEDFCVKGSSLAQRLSGGGAWSEFSYGKNVVKLWDSLGLNLDFDEDLFNYDSKSVVTTWDEQNNSDFPAAAPTMLLTAKGNAKGDGVIFGGYDTRMRRRSPALYAEWNSPAEKGAVPVAVSSSGGVGKIFVRDDVSSLLTVGDVRNVRQPLESDVETWWDADAVIVEDEFSESR